VLSAISNFIRPLHWWPPRHPSGRRAWTIPINVAAHFVSGMASAASGTHMNEIDGGGPCWLPGINAVSAAVLHWAEVVQLPAFVTTGDPPPGASTIMYSVTTGWWSELSLQQPWNGSLAQGLVSRRIALRHWRITDAAMASVNLYRRATRI
jgi:hypothetical protein